jgi:hypothetical protein
MASIEYFHGDGTLTRRTDGIRGGLEIYRSGGRWERIVTPEWFFTNADLIDEEAAKEMMAYIDKRVQGMPKPAENTPS